MKYTKWTTVKTPSCDNNKANNTENLKYQYIVTIFLHVRSACRSAESLLKLGVSKTVLTVSENLSSENYLRYLGSEFSYKS